MSALTDHLGAAELEKLFTLPTPCRAELARRLIDSLEAAAGPDVDADAKAFTAMIEARIARADADPASLLPVDEVIARVRANLEAQGKAMQKKGA